MKQTLIAISRKTYMNFSKIYDTYDTMILNTCDTMIL